MPSIKQSVGPNMSGWQPTPAKPQDATLQTTDRKDEPPVNSDYPNMSPFMLASMPLMASTNDALTQFYGNWSIPQFRTVPMQHGGNS
jgi:hypothetical protein